MNNIEAARKKHAQMIADGTFKQRNPLEKAQNNPKSRKLAIDAHCWQCQGEDADPCVHWRIGNCEIPRCALYLLRPYQHLTGTPTPKSLVVE